MVNLLFLRMVIGLYKLQREKHFSRLENTFNTRSVMVFFLPSKMDLDYFYHSKM